MDEHEEVLIKEYELCQDSGYQNESHTWQTGTLFIGLSLAGISLLGQSEIRSWDRFVFLVIIAGVSIITLLLWRGILDRWYQIMNVRWYRMEEIEAELGYIYKNRYIDWLDRKVEIDSLAKKDQIHLKNLHHRFPKWRGPSIRKNTRILVYILIASWGAFVLKDLIFLILLGPTK